MSTSAPEPTNAPAEPADTGTEPHASPEDWLHTLPLDAQNEIKRTRTEAAKYRTERNTSRDEAATLRTRLDGHDKRRVESLAGDRLHDARDFTERVKLDELRGDDGEINEQAVTERLDALLAERPHLAKPASGPTHRQWSQGSGGNGTGREQPSFGKALKNRQR